MKDLPHHIKKLNRKVIRSVHREEQDEEAFDLKSPPRKQTERQIKKQAKEKMRQATTSRTPTPLTPSERAKKMVKRVPIFDRTNNAKPKHAKATKKKTPRI
jgi:hypothetical protein